MDLLEHGLLECQDDNQIMPWKYQALFERKWLPTKCPWWQELLQLFVIGKCVNNRKNIGKSCSGIVSNYEG
jgi:hypothetical protein